MYLWNLLALYDLVHKQNVQNLWQLFYIIFLGEALLLLHEIFMTFFINLAHFMIENCKIKVMWTKSAMNITWQEN